MLLKNEENKAVWKRIETELHFRPSINSAVIPFSINKNYVIYDICQMTEEQIDKMDRLITDTLIQCTPKGDLLYALDWNHSGFLFDPRKEEERKSLWIENSRFTGGGYHAYFPSYYPDGDYFFFIDFQFCFGYLGHPWRHEVWIFGDVLLQEMEKIEKQLGWHKKKEKIQKESE